MPRKPTASRHDISHDRILEAAARTMRRDGYAGAGVATVMKQAGLTHGGFYAHFDSREAMLAEAIDYDSQNHDDSLRQRMQTRIGEGASPFRALVEEYLSERHLLESDRGCAVAALASEMVRTDGLLRAASGRKIQRFIHFVEQSLDARVAKQDASIIAGALVGALQMARVLDGEARQGVLQHCRASLLSRFDIVN